MHQPRYTNYPLITGMLLALIFVTLAIFGPALAPHDPLQQNSYLFIDGRVYMAPFRPMEIQGFLLGSDEAGRDVLSRILWGIRPTLLLCLVVAVTRMVIGVVLGLVSGWFRGPAERLVDAVSSLGMTLPILVVSLMAIFVIGVERGLIAFLIALTIAGWIDIAKLVQTRTLTIAQAPYIESARGLGIGSFGLVRRHLLPQLWPLLPVLFAFELSAVLLLVTELGFLGIFIGGGVTYEVDEGVRRLTAEYPELGQQISRFWTKFYNVPWEFLAVGSIIFLQIVAFNLIGEGLRRRLDVTQPRRLSVWQRLHIPDTLLDRVPQPNWRWAVAGLAVVTFALGAWTFARVLPVASDEAASATPVAPSLSNQPVSVDQLATVDMEAILSEPGVLPDQYSIFQVSNRVPDLFRRVPNPDNTFHISLNRASLYDGTVTTLLYADAPTRDEAVQTMVEAVGLRGFSAPSNDYLGSLLEPDEQAVAGERSFTFGLWEGGDRAPPEFYFPQPQEVIFVRCSAAVHVQLGASGNSFTFSDTLDESLASLVRSLDQQLAPQACRQE